MIRTLPVLFAGLLAVGCETAGPTFIEVGPDDTAVDEDRHGPAITHECIDGAQLYNVAVTIEANVVDYAGDDPENPLPTSAIVEVFVHYTQQTSNYWEKSTLSPKDTAGNYGGQIPGADIYTGGMRYYIAAKDLAGNESFYPAGGEGDPCTFRVTVE